MSFYDRYQAACAAVSLDPCCQRAADLFGVTRGTISAWKKNGTAPKGETIALISRELHVSADYLLELTDDPVDYQNSDLAAELPTEVLNEFNGDLRKAAAYQQSVDEDAAKDCRPEPDILRKYRMLDELDRAKLDAYIDGLLANEKYAQLRRMGA